jgi:hypothetical protein
MRVSEDQLDFIWRLLKRTNLYYNCKKYHEIWAELKRKGIDVLAMTQDQANEYILKLWNECNRQHAKMDIPEWFKPYWLRYKDAESGLGGLGINA